MPKEKRTIKNRHTGQIIAEGEFNSVAELASNSRADLYGADLYRADLSGADLFGADLSGATLYRANLSRANLSGADLSGADLSIANLSGADLSGADLFGADLSGADLSGARIGDYVLTGQYMQLAGVCEWGPMFAYVAKDSGLRVMVGCRHFSAAEARTHWKNPSDRRMTRFALIAAEAWYRAVTKGAKKA